MKRQASESGPFAMLQRLHHDEGGAVEPLHAVMLVAVGCVILAVIVAIFPDVRTAFQNAVKKIINFR